ncbi:exocyst complex component EXO84A-like protein [Tanacetum coccineum]
MFTGGTSSIVYEQCHDYCLLMNSGRIPFFATGSSIHEELVNVFRNYVAILERASLMKQTIYLFKDMNGLRDVIGNRMLSVAGTWIILTLTCCGMRCLLLLIRKVEELAEDNIVEFDWLVSLLTEVVETKCDWISKNGKKWMIHDNEDSKNGGYLTANMVNSLTYLISRMESAIVSTGFTLNRYAVDYKKVINSALQAIKELEALMEQKWHSYEDFDQLDEEYQARSSYNSIEDDDC